MDRDELMARIEQRCEELGLDPDEAFRRFLRGEPVEAATDPDPESVNDSVKEVAKPTLSVSTAKQDSAASMVSSPEPEPDPFETDPRLVAAYEQTRREMTGEADDVEQQAARAFGSRFAQADSYASPQETARLLDAIRRAYGKR